MEGIIMLSNNLKSIRKSRKITQEALASKLNVTRQTISKWENGQSVPDAESLTQIIAYRACIAGAFFGCFSKCIFFN